MIHVGQTSAVKSAGLDTRNLNQDGYILQGLDTQNYAIAGGIDSDAARSLRSVGEKIKLELHLQALEAGANTKEVHRRI